MTGALSDGSASAKGNLRKEPSRFIGREDDLERLHDLVQRHRVVSVVGPAGLGKTRLTMRYGALHEADFSSIWFFDLRRARDADHVIEHVMSELGGRDEPTSGSAARVACSRSLAARAGALVVLDNVEQLDVGATHLIAEWFEAMPAVRFVLTSRAPIGFPNETILELSALSLPRPGSSSSPAVHLFVDRVRAHRGVYTPPPGELSSISRIVRTLSGIPLAIELAAARYDTTETLRLLQGSGAFVRDASETLESTARRAIRHTFELLAPAEREILAQCSTFRASFSLESATSVVRIPVGHTDVVVRRLVPVLARKSLLEVHSMTPLRFTMAASVRSYASEALALSSNHGEAVDRYTAYWLSRAISRDAVPLDRTLDFEDLRSAFSISVKERPNPTNALHLAVALDSLSQAGLSAEDLALLDDALAAGAATDLVLAGRALGVRASSLYGLGKLTEAKRDAETALCLGTELSDAKQMGAMLRLSGVTSMQLGDLPAADERLTRALAVDLERGDNEAIAFTRYYLGSLASTRGDRARAMSEFTLSLSLARAAGDAPGEMRALRGLAWQEFEHGDPAVARARFLDALVIARRLAAGRSERIIEGYLGLVEFEARNLSTASKRLERAAMLARQAGDAPLEGIFSGIRGAVLASLDRIEEARNLFDVAIDLLRDNRYFKETIEVHRGHLELAEGHALRVSGDMPGAEAKRALARARIASARADEGGSGSLVNRSDDARVAVRILEHAIATS